MAASRRDLRYCQVALAACNETCGVYETAFRQQQWQLQEHHKAYKALNTDYGRAVNELSAMATSNLKLRYELGQAHRTVDALKLKVEEPCPHLRSGTNPAGTGHKDIGQADRNLAGYELAARECIEIEIKQPEREKAHMKQEHEKENADLMQAHQEAVSNAVGCIAASERKIEQLQTDRYRSEPQEEPSVASPEPISL